MTADEILNEIDYIINYLYAMRRNERLTAQVLRIQAGQMALRLEVLRSRLTSFKTSLATNPPPCVTISGWIGVQAP
jgi:hypothetical protein